MPVEVSDDVVSSFLASFSDVVHVTRSTYKDFPSVRDGNRVVRIVLKQDVPCFVRIAYCNCRVWYSRQPVQCAICRESGHVARDCSLSGRCRRCHQQGHVARLCTQAWGPSRASADRDQPVIDEDVGDDGDDGGQDDDDNDDTAAPVPVPCVPAAVPKPPKVSVPAPPASVLFPAPVASPKSPKVSSQRTTRLERLRVVADTNAHLRGLLSIIGHVVTEGLLERINVPMNSVEFFRRLIKLSRERLDHETRNTVNKKYGNM